MISVEKIISKGGSSNIKIGQKSGNLVSYFFHFGGNGMLLNALMKLYETDNISEAVTKAIVEVATEGKSKKKCKTLFPYVGKKPPRIAREVVEAFHQSGCKVFVDLFCGSLAILCYLPEDTKVIQLLSWIY